MIDRNDFTRKNLSDIVVDYVKEKILIGEFKEGDHVLETNVANELNISRAPVREGIKELQNQGLIRFVPRKGNYVTILTVEDIKEIFDIRLLIENSVLDILINDDKLKGEDFRNLMAIVKSMVDITNGKGDLKEKTLKVNKKDIEFHNYLWHKSGSKRRMKILSDLHFQLQMAMVIDTNLTGNLEVTATDHYEIIKHLKNKDLEKCKIALKDHIISYRSGIFDRRK